MTVLALQSISGGYGETEILHGVSMHVDAGEIVVIIGPNGAGKSTAMKAVLGLLNITAGTIILADEDITGTPPGASCTAWGLLCAADSEYLP